MEYHSPAVWKSWLSYIQSNASGAVVSPRLPPPADRATRYTYKVKIINLLKKSEVNTSFHSFVLLVIEAEN